MQDQVLTDQQIVRPAHVGPGGVSGATLIQLLFALLATDQMLLWRYLGLTSPLLWSAGVLAIAVTGIWLRSAAQRIATVSMQRLLLLFCFSIIVLIVAGEGRFFYANIDWQVRDAVLRDMAMHPWPFAYGVDGQPPQMLRAPIGIYLIPALIWKAAGPTAADLAMLVQNAALLTIVLALGSSLFDGRRARLIALTMATLFSGLDAIGHWLTHPAWESHLEFWFDWLQLSSHITQLFWVPMHAIAGWTAAILILLWRKGVAPVGIVLAILPLTLLWSPFALLGVIPFLAFAVVQDLRHRRISAGDIIAPSLTSLLSVPSLLFLGAAGDGVGIRLLATPLAPWLLFMTLEVLVWSVPLWIIARRYPALQGPHQRAFIVIATLFLLLSPLVQIGWSIDFMMRASIPALAILCAMAAHAWVLTPSRVARLVLMVMLTLASITGLSEARRAFELPASPRGTCSFFGAWDVSFKRYPKGSYLAPISKIPAIIRPQSPATAAVHDPAHCWKGDWVRPSGV